MTVRDLVNEILDMQLWQGFLLFCAASYVGGFASAAARDFRAWRESRRGQR